MYIEREKERLYVRIFDCLKLLPINRSILYFSIINIPTYAYVYILKLDSPSRFFRSAHFGFDRSSRQTFHVYFNISFERNEVCAIFGLERVLKSVITVKILCFFFVFQATEKGRKEERKKGRKNKERRKKLIYLRLMLVILMLMQMLSDNRGVTLAAVAISLRTLGHVQDSRFIGILLSDQCAHRLGTERRRCFQLFDFLYGEVFQPRGTWRFDILVSILGTESCLRYGNVHGFVDRRINNRLG